MIYILPMNLERKSSLLIILACLLWALDLLVRYPLSLKMGYVSIVFLESLTGLLFVTPWIVTKGRKELAQYSKQDWLLGVFIGGIGLSIGGYLQTVSVLKSTPGTFSFFQIWQPIFVIFAARKFLNERVDNMYIYWGIWVVLSAFLLFSSDLELMFATQEFVLTDILIALGCMLIWGTCTIVAKKLLMKHSPFSLVTVRWVFAFIFSSAILVMEGESIAWDVLLQSEVVLRFLFIVGIAGVGSMYFYYSGLKNIYAGKSSFLELAFPALSMIFSAIYTFEGLTFLQTLGVISFFAFIFLMLSRQESSPTPAVRAR